MTLLRPSNGGGHLLPQDDDRFQFGNAKCEDAENAFEKEKHLEKQGNVNCLERTMNLFRIKNNREKIS